MGCRSRRARQIVVAQAGNVLRACLTTDHLQDLGRVDLRAEDGRHVGGSHLIDQCRYFTRRRDEDKPLPDLVVIDGGKGQLNAAQAALDALGLGAMPIISLAKREEELFLPDVEVPVRLPDDSSALHLVQHVRDEAHRFAITFHRQRRAKKFLGAN